MKLTKREKEVLNLISEGLTAEQIAKEWNRSARTINKHVSNMMQNNEAKNSCHLVAMFITDIFVTLLTKD